MVVPSRAEIGGAVLVISLMLLSTAFMGSVTAQESEDIAVELEERVTRLRQEGRYAEAAGVAGEWLEILEADIDRPAWEFRVAESTTGYLRFASSLPETLQSRLAEADTATVLIFDLYAKGDYGQLADVAEQQLKIRRRILGRNHPQTAESMVFVAIGLEELGQYGPAESLLREALSLNRKILGGEHPNLATNLNNLGRLLQTTGEYGEAKSLFREALAMDRRLWGNRNVDVAIDLNNLAFLLQGQGNYHEAEPLYREALEIYRSLLGEGHPNVASILDNLGYLLRAQGNWVGAEALYREALAMRQRLLGEEHPLLANSYNNLAFLLHHQGRYAAAEELYRKALSIERKRFGEEHPRIAATINNLAGLAGTQGDFEAADRLYREGLEMRRRLLGDEHPGVAQSLNNLANLLEITGKLAAAESLRLEAMETVRKGVGHEHPLCATTLNALANLYRTQGEDSKAEPLYREALAVRRKLLGEGHPHVASSLSNLASLLQDSGGHQEAESLFAQAADVFEVARLRVWTGDRRVTLLSSPYTRMAAVKLSLGKTAEAWPAAERSLGRVLADLLLTSGGRPLTPAEHAREDSLRKTVANLERQLGTFRKAARGDSTGETASRIEATLSKLLAAETDLATFVREIAAKYPVAEGQSFELQRVQAALTAEDAIIGWLDVSAKDGESDSWGYVIRDRGPVVWAKLPSHPPSPSDSLPFRRARALRDDLASPAFPPREVPPAARDLWVERIEPLIPALDEVRELAVIPSGAMLGIPVEALIDQEGSFLGDCYAASYVPSATVYAWLVERRATGRRGIARALLIGDPPLTEDHLAAMEQEDQGAEIIASTTGGLPDGAILRSAMGGDAEALATLPRLPGTREEIAAIRRSLSEATILMGADASEQEIVRLADSGALGGFDAIHFATHALVDDERPDRSALVLSQVNLPDPLEAAIAGTRIYDGVLTAREIIQEWEIDADLVTLSGCQTALGKELAGEGYVGFAHAFFQAGARSLIVSLWDTEDRATSLLMQRFYENLGGKYSDERNGRVGEAMSKAEALQEAKRWLRTYKDARGHRPFAHPYYWSAFILVGDRG